MHHLILAVGPMHHLIHDLSRICQVIHTPIGRIHNFIQTVGRIRHPVHPTSLSHTRVITNDTTRCIDTTNNSENRSMQNETTLKNEDQIR